jgi:hypothetical protein
MPRKGSRSSKGRLRRYSEITGKFRIKERIHSEASQTGLRVKDLRIANKTTLAFIADPGRAQVQFDLAIDGEPASSRTFLGRLMARPETIPFSRDARDKSVRSRGVPAGKVDPPYFLIWHSRSRFTDHNKISLNDDTARAIKALGYIQ